MKKYVDAYLPVAILFALSAYFLWDTRDFTEDALMYPQGLAWVLLVLTALLLLATFMRKIPQKIQKDERIPRKFAIILIASILYVFSVPHLGFVLSSLLFCPITALSLGYKRKGLALTVSAATVALVYIGFKMLLKVPLPTVTLFGITL